ncbi:hypothetical protein TWF506_001026 [Arthrobotrys conoides]|uniref:Uncharacterized protein n=1 Tax=Arthrobotrys conoides TaxID=74498 RepID=A0AAN8P1C2_9PEZI
MILKIQQILQYSNIFSYFGIDITGANGGYKIPPLSTSPRDFFLPSSTPPYLSILSIPTLSVLKLPFYFCAFYFCAFCICAFYSYPFTFTNTFFFWKAIDMVNHSRLLTTPPDWPLGEMAPTTKYRSRFASIDEVITKAIATDGAVSPPPSAQAPAPSKVKSLIAAWSQRAEAPDVITKKSSLKGLKHLGPKHVQTRVQQFSRPTAVTEVAKIEGGLVKQRIAALEDVKAACQYALDRQQNDRPRSGQLGAQPTVATPTGPTPSPDRDVSTPTPTPTPTEEVTSSPDSFETESKALMREIEHMDIMSSASRHYHDWHSDQPTPDLHPMVRAPTDSQRETGLNVGVSAIPPLTGSARVFGTRRYKREPLTEEQYEIQAATKVTRRLVSDTHWLKAKKPAAAIPIGTNIPVVPARLLQGAQSLRKPTSKLPIAKYYTNNYDPENNDVILPLRIHKMPTAQNASHPPPHAPLGNYGGFTEYKVANRFGILGARPRLVAARPRFGENLAPTKVRGNQDVPTFPRVPKLRRRTPPQVTIDFFNKVWPNGTRKPSA